MEAMIVVVCVGLIAVFVVPSYTKTIMKMKVRNAMTNLKLIHIASEEYKRQNDSYWVASAALADINQNLGISIIKDDADTIYYYLCVDPVSYSAAVRIHPGQNDETYISMTNDPVSATNPVCEYGVCS